MFSGHKKNLEAFIPECPQWLRACDQLQQVLVRCLRDCFPPTLPMRSNLNFLCALWQIMSFAFSCKASVTLTMSRMCAQAKYIIKLIL